MEDTEFDAVKQGARDLEGLLSVEKDIEEHIASLFRDDYGMIGKLEESISAARLEIDRIKCEMSATTPEPFDELMRVRNEIENKKSAIKKSVSAIPIDLIRAGKKITEGAVQVSVNRSATTVAYNEALLHDHPELEEMYADGDPLVQRKINAVIVDRLVAEGKISKEDVEPYRLEIRKRNPSVRIEVIDEK